jgi:hypothetical protein
MIRRPNLSPALLLLLLVATAASAEGLRDSSSVVKLTVQPASVSAAVGDQVTWKVELDIEKGWHLYAHGDPKYYGIALAGLDSLPLAGAEVAYPAGKKGKFLDETVQLLEGRQTLTVSGFLVAEPAGPMLLELELQACDQRSCLAPAWLPIQLVVEPKR